MYKKIKNFFSMIAGIILQVLGDDPIQFHRDGCTGISLYGHMDSMRGAGKILYQYYEGNITPRAAALVVF